MSTAAAPPATRRAAVPTTTWLDRVLAAVPLLVGVLSLGILYAWLAWSHRTPWLFTDELELTQISRAIADTGHPARRGVAYSCPGLIPHLPSCLASYISSPAWLIHDTQTAYDVAKYIQVAAMTAAAFPAYWLARLLVPPRYAVIAALGAVGAPALAYSSQMLEEPFAYPVAAFVFFFTAKALVTRKRRWVAAAVVSAVVAPLVRDQLIAASATLVIAALFMLWQSDAARARRAHWSAGDWVGCITLVALALIVISAVLGSKSHEWLVATRFYKDRIVEYGLWAVGALTIGLGILPVVVGLAKLFPARGEERSRERRAFRSVLAAAILGFGLYTAVKAAYISTNFSTLVEERNIIYLAPLFSVATAWWLYERRLRLLPLLAAIGFAAYLIVSTPYQMQFHLYFDAYGLSFLQVLNRQVSLDPTGATWLLLCMLAIAAAVLLAPRFLRGRRGRAALPGLAAAAAVLALAWSIAGAVSAGTSSNSFARSFAQQLPTDFSWVDHATGGQPALFLGQALHDPNAVHELEFWNRSLKQVWSLDGTAPPPGPVLTPDLAKPTGELRPDPGYPYVVAGPGVELVGQVVAAPPPVDFRLFRITPPLRLAEAVTGVQNDGWIGCSFAFKGCIASAAYSKFTTPGNRAGYVRVGLSRLGWTGPNVPGRVVVRVGRLVVGADHQPALGAVTATRVWQTRSGEQKIFTIPAPRPPFRVEIQSDTLSPSDFGASDTRRLGVQPDFSFTTRPAKDVVNRLPGF